MNLSPMLSLALDALTSGWYGHIDNVPELSLRGRHKYGQALTGLRHALGKIGSNEAWDLQLLVTIELLALYDLYEYGHRSMKGWLAHLEGAENILKARPDLVTNVAAYRKIFLSHRLIAVSVA